MEFMAQVRRWLYTAWAHNYWEQLRINRAVTRRRFNLAQDDAPIPPGATVDSNKPTTTINHNAGGLLKGLLLGASLLAGGTAGGVALLGGGKPVQTPVPTPVVTPAVPATPTRPADHWDAVYEVQQPDGTWKEVRREHLK